jgi:hypothetical protein
LFLKAFSIATCLFLSFQRFQSLELNMYSFATSLMLASAFSTVYGTPLEARNVIGKLPSGASELEHKFQPYADFDKDSCYYTSAIDGNGVTNGGIPKRNWWAKDVAQGCRDGARLDSNNVYSRSRCNNGWCAIMYEYYFEKDQVSWGNTISGHQDDWENVVIFVKDNQVKRVAPSCHGGYSKATNSPRLQDNTHAKVVFHKDGGGTHCWRNAEEKDDKVENERGSWLWGTLVGWNNWPKASDGGSLRDKMFLRWQEGVAPKFWDHKDVFTNKLREAAGNDVPGFDPAKDA